jgi:hypothetical protein
LAQGACWGPACALLGFVFDRNHHVTYARFARDNVRDEKWALLVDAHGKFARGFLSSVGAQAGTGLRRGGGAGVDEDEVEAAVHEHDAAEACLPGGTVG